MTTTMMDDDDDDDDDDEDDVSEDEEPDSAAEVRCCVSATALQNVDRFLLTHLKSAIIY